MFEIKDLLAEIQAGTNPDELADAFAKSLNAAMDLDKKQKEAEAAAKAKAEKEAAEKAAKSAKLDACVQAMATAMSDYIAIAEPDLVAEIGEDEIIDIKMIRDALDAALAAAKLALKMAKTFDEPTANATKSADDSITQFLKNFGLLN